MNNEVKLGEYVEYEPEARTSAKYKVFDRTFWKETDKYFSTQIGYDAFEWRYMGEDEEGKILIASDRPTDDALYLRGKEGYTQGPSILNNLCKELYSSQMGEARSINVDDVNRLLGAKPVGRYWDGKGNKVYNNENLTIGEIISQNCERELFFAESPETGKNINEYVPNKYIYDEEKYKFSDGCDLIFRNSLYGHIGYFLASTYVDVDFQNSYVEFGMRIIKYSELVDSDMFNSCGDERRICNRIRPVVVLNSNIQLGEKVNGVWTLKEV